MDTVAFDKFRESFTAFEEQVKAVRAGAKEVSSGFTGVSAAVERTWASVSKHIKTISGNIVSATRSLLRWVEIGGIISGLFGIGSLWGLDRLANAAGNMRRSVLGQNITPGEQRAFTTTYSRLFSDPGQFLGAVNAAMHDRTQRIGLYGAGLSENVMRGKDTGQVADLLITAIGKIADATPDDMMAQVLKAMHIDQFVTLEDFERIKATPPAERAEYQKEYQDRQEKLKLSDEELKAWQKLQNQLHFVGVEIEHSLIRALKPLAPHLEALSKAFVGMFTTLLKNPAVAHWIDEVAAALNTFAIYVGKPEFEQDVNKLVTHVGRIAKSLGDMLPSFETFCYIIKTIFRGVYRVTAASDAIVGAFAAPFVTGMPLSHDEALRWNKDHPDMPITVPPNSVPLELPLPPFSWWDPGTWLYHSSGNLGTGNSQPGAGSSQLHRPVHDAGPGRPMSQSDLMQYWNSTHPDHPDVTSGFQLQSYSPSQLPGPGRPMSQSDLMQYWNSTHPDHPDVTSGFQLQSYSPNAGTGRTIRSWGDLLYAVEGAESSHGRDPTMWRPNRAGALGWMQSTPDAWQDFAEGRPRTDALDRLQSWQVAKNELSHYMNVYGFDLQKMLAAYNWGPRHVNEAMAYARKYGRSWLDDPRMPKETHDYLKRILGAGGDTDAYQQRSSGRPQPSGGRPHPEDPYQQKFRNSRTRIEICNNTGGNATVTAAQLAT